MTRVFILCIASVTLTACVAPPPKPNDPYYAPVLPRTPIPASQNQGAIYQSGFDVSLWDDRRARRIGDVITITLDESTQASKNADSKLTKDSTTDLGLTSFLGGVLSMSSPISSNRKTLDASYDARRETDGSGEAEQSNSLTGSITVTISEVLPNGVLAVRGEKWVTLNTGDELIRISGLIRKEDIMPDNTVSSSRVADARITYSGTGTFAEASQPGWLDRFFISPLWPF
ncbi:flagellar L-ring protein precursor FlgH [Azomonas agilis]|uniref:Flagellar L-ring protein n=1 Tax=Azomonas agilis TaxID=116849 RepID=A0A562I2U6_9GAMM|nr:flagellar basal body L-ring protein FlgH [Azomonas agilis]TWH64985.1 flagellar L-ring protein precursor FlgH [Azomonas agilis]